MQLSDRQAGVAKVGAPDAPATLIQGSLRKK
jgi:hypothetical protein